MLQDDDISLWIEKLKDGDDRAPEVIWQHYFEKLVQLARRRMGDIPRRAADEEDVAISAMHSMFRCVDDGRLPRLNDRDDLWKILVTITARKAIKQQRRHFADKRGGGKVHGESLFGNRPDSGGLEQFLSREPTAELTGQMTETCGELISVLGNEKLRSVVLWKLEGYTNDEIASKLDCTTRTVERKLERVREKWSNWMDPD